MKKLLLLILLLFLSLPLFATISPLNFEVKNNDIFLTTGVYQEIENFNVYYNYTNKIVENKSFIFSPIQGQSTLGIKYKIQIIEIKIERLIFINGGYTKFQVKIGNK